MRGKKVITSKGEKLCSTTFELVCGEYGQIFEKAFDAKNEKSLKNQIHKYLKDYYGEGNNDKVDGNVYYYFDGEVAVKNHGWEETKNFKQLVSKLL
jgi:hypothetical protein